MKLEVSRKWLLAGGIAAAILIVFAIITWQVKSIDIPLVGQGGSIAETEAHTDVNDQFMPGLDLQRCVILWNKPSNDYGRELISGYSDQPPYVSVGFSEIYPDKCLITAANPDLGRAFQFNDGGQGSGGGESGLGPFGFPVSEGSPNTLPPSATNWNASADSEGFLRLNP